jgi:aspartate-semialdehyde dehydrogenase
VHEPLRPRPESAHRLRVADSLAVVLAELLAPLRSLSPRSVSAVVLRPAAAQGASGLDELREQTVRLLRFESPPTEVFGKPLAFNLIPEPFADGAPSGVRGIAADVAEILGPGGPEVTARVATAPWFHGHMLFVHLQGLSGDRTRLREVLSAAQAVELLEDGSGFTAADGPEERRTVVYEAEREGDGAWILALAAEAETAAARQAVAVAAAAGRL